VEVAYAKKLLFETKLSSALKNHVLKAEGLEIRNGVKRAEAKLNAPRVGLQVESLTLIV
jgi:hypothetical protein